MSVFRIYASLDGELESVDVCEATSEEMAVEYGRAWSEMLSKGCDDGGRWSIAVEMVS